MPKKAEVEYPIAGFPEPPGVAEFEDRVAAVRRGIPRRAVRSLAAYLNLSERQLLSYLDITPRTLQRYEDGKALKSDVSEHAIRIYELARQGTEYFGSRERFINWLNRPNRAMGGEKPADFLDTHTGILELQEVITRLEYGLTA